jgi:myo-inositol-1(or 4)-monophosphatase
MQVNDNLSHHLSFIAIQAVLQAGDILRKGFGSYMQIQAKPGRQNFVTEYDHASEAYLIDFIKHHFPTHAFLAEERGFLEGSKENEIMWIIDPLDGTTNFSRHIPLFTISLAAYHGNKGLCGVIYQPLTNEIFVAERGKGAYLNGKRLKVSLIKQLSEAVLGTGFPSEEPEIDRHLKQLSYFIQTGASLRNLGSAALNLAYVAAGKIDGFWINYLHPWDFAAAKLLIEEAGGEVTGYDGLPLNLTDSTNLVATNKLLHSTMIKSCF